MGTARSALRSFGGQPRRRPGRRRQRGRHVRCSRPRWPVRSTRVQEVVTAAAATCCRPAWDFADRLWLVDRTRRRRRRVCSSGGRGPRELDVPRVTGRRVRSFLVSRDGSRLVAVVRGRPGDELDGEPDARNDQGRVVGATRARRISWEGDGALPIRDIAWTSPTTIAVLHRVASHDRRGPHHLRRRVAVAGRRPAHRAERPGCGRWPGRRCRARACTPSPEPCSTT